MLARAPEIVRVPEFVRALEHARDGVAGRLVQRDPDDDAVLACAVAVKADLVVSGDPHLVKLTQYEGIPIVAPAEAVARLGL